MPSKEKSILFMFLYCEMPESPGVCNEQVDGADTQACYGKGNRCILKACWDVGGNAISFSRL